MLPSPLPDDPRKWDGWGLFNSPDLYVRLGFAFEEHPTNEQIEENTRQLLVWWQKKLPLKNQPSNPLAQLLRGGIDHAPRCIAEARVELLNPERRAQLDAALQGRQRESALGEFRKFLDFALSDGVLTAEGEANLAKLGKGLKLSEADITGTISVGLRRTGARRGEAAPPPAPPPPPPSPAEPPRPAVAAAAVTPALPKPAVPALAPETPRIRRTRHAAPQDDFARMLRLSGLDGDSMTDERRDTFIDMAENLGLDPGEAEDMVDAYLAGIEDGSVQPTVAASSPLAGERAAAAPRPSAAAAAKGGAAPLLRASPGKPADPAGGKATQIVPPVVAEMTREEENRRFPDFATSLGARMFFIPSATFPMGSNAPGATANEQPLTRVTVSRFYLSRYPVTNAEYEKFDPAHKSRRGAWADDAHPVIYVSSLDAARFCQWLSARERKRYRLPTEAEWEYAAKGPEARTYPWGEQTGVGTLANFADANTTFPWRDAGVNDGHAETSPVGAYPEGASPFGVEDLAGNVWEWCGDFYEPYKGTERTNPRGPVNGAQRVYRGGSWKSRFSNLRTTARGYNQPGYASNDVGFRLVCECD